MAFDVEYELRLRDQRIGALESIVNDCIAEIRTLRATLGLKADSALHDDDIEGLGGEIDEHAWSLNQLREQVDQTASKEEVEAATAGVLNAAMDAAQVIGRAAARQHVPKVVVKTLIRDEKGRVTGCVERVQELLGDAKP